jgi:hypothetical protein
MAAKDEQLVAMLALWFNTKAPDVDPVNYDASTKRSQRTKGGNGARQEEVAIVWRVLREALRGIAAAHKTGPSQRSRKQRDPKHFEKPATTLCFRMVSSVLVYGFAPRPVMEITSAPVAGQ